MSLMHGMKIYTVHVKPDDPHGAEKAVFVREGFSIWAFLFLFLWTLSKRLWLASALVFAAYAGLVALAASKLVPDTTVAVLQITLGVITGFHAHDWWRAKLAASDHIMADVVTGDSLLRAEQRYFDRYLAAA